MAEDKAPAKPKAPAKTAKKVALVDINTASQQQLEAIPEIGKEHCHHIIMGRPYESTEDLVSKSVLPKETYDKVKHRITVAKVEKPVEKKPAEKK
jgi:DNA uptake protein ComE-like DNA-binding protein